MIGIEDKEEGFKIWRLGGWQGNSAIEEMNEVKGDALLYWAVTQGQEMKAFEWVKYAVGHHVLEKQFTGELETRGGGPRKGTRMIWGNLQGES